MIDIEVSETVEVRFSAVTVISSMPLDLAVSSSSSSALKPNGENATKVDRTR